MNRIAPVYLDHIVIGGVAMPGGRHAGGEGWREEVMREVERALYGRLEGIAGDSTSDSPISCRTPQVVS